MLPGGCGPGVGSLGGVLLWLREWGVGGECGAVDLGWVSPGACGVLSYSVHWEQACA